MAKKCVLLTQPSYVLPLVVGHVAPRSLICVRLRCPRVTRESNRVGSDRVVSGVMLVLELTAVVALFGGWGCGF